VTSYVVHLTVQIGFMWLTQSSNLLARSGAAVWLEMVSFTVYSL
jgi:hypothetical protein